MGLGPRWLRGFQFLICKWVVRRKAEPLAIVRMEYLVTELRKEMEEWWVGGRDFHSFQVE